MKREEEEDASKNVNGSNINSDDIKLASKQKQSVPKCHIWFRALPSFLPSSRRHVSSRLLSVSALFFLSEKKKWKSEKNGGKYFSFSSFNLSSISLFLSAGLRWIHGVYIKRGQLSSHQVPGGTLFSTATHCWRITFHPGIIDAANSWRHA